MSTIAQELANELLPGVNPYVVLESDAPPQGSHLPGSLGCTGRTLDLIIENWLRDRDEWRGRAPAIYVADIAIRRLAAGEAAGDPVMAETQNRQWTASVVCHEAAHVAESVPDLSIPTHKRREFAAAIAAYSISIADNYPFPPFFGHSSGFVRNAIHLAHRAAALGFEFPVDLLFFGENYHIAEPSDFAYALDREPECLANVPIFEIHTFTPRRNFTRLWNDCVNHWINQQTPGDTGVSFATKLLLT